MGQSAYAYVETREPGKAWRHEHRLHEQSLDLLCRTLVGPDGDPSTGRYPARGLPDDASEKTITCFGDPGDFYTPSWVTVDELLFTADIMGLQDFESLRGLRNIAAKYAVEVRVVFWFGS